MASQNKYCNNFGKNGHYEYGTNLINKPKIIPFDKAERIKNMSFNCLYMTDDYIIIGSDSRETLSSSFYNDSMQKTFINKEQKLVWSMTGICKYKNIDYIKLVNEVMNSQAELRDKCILIQHLLKYPTKDKSFSTSNIKIRFNLLVGVFENNNPKFYSVEVINGKCSNTNGIYDKINYPFASGVHFEQCNYLNLKIMDNKIKDDCVLEFTKLISDVIEYDKDKTKTVGGDVYVAYMDRDGNITTYINGKEAEF